MLELERDWLDACLSPPRVFFMIRFSSVLSNTEYGYVFLESKVSKITQITKKR